MYNSIIKDFQPLSIYTAKPNNTLIQCIDSIIDDSSASLSINLNQQFELLFTCTKLMGESNIGYDALQEGMYLFVDKIGLFKMKQPNIEIDGTKEVKSITAYSTDIELEDKNCKFALNMGTENSQEYLVRYLDDETEKLINPYTGLLYDYQLPLYNTFPEQLCILRRLYEDNEFGSADENGDTEITFDSNPSGCQELERWMALIPRLRSKSVISTETLSNNEEISITEPYDYIIYLYDDTTNEHIGYMITNEFEARINELIGFYTIYRNQLSLIQIVLDETGGNWSVGNIYGVGDISTLEEMAEADIYNKYQSGELDFTLVNTKCQFDLDETVYSFFGTSLAQAIECITGFDIVNRKINITPVDEIGEDTGIVFGYDNLLNTLSISANEDNLATRLYITGANDLGIEQVNFGSPYVDDITYKLNAKDSQGNRIYVSDELAEKYRDYIDYRESQRENYIEFSKEYNDYNEQISEIKYRVPNDDLKTDWGTFSQKELTDALAEFKNARNTLISLYREDYPDGVNSDDSVNESYIKETEYWYDYCAYNNIIIQIEAAIDTFPYYSNQDKWTDDDIATYKEQINAWETDWSLYGTIELQAKVDGYMEQLNALIENGSVIVQDGTWSAKLSNVNYTIPTIYPWRALTSEQQASFGGAEANYFYDDYMKIYNLITSAPGRTGAIEYLDDLLQQVKDYEELQNNAQTERNIIVDNVSLESYFTKDEIKNINLLYRDSSYSNDYILTTSLNNTVDSLDVMEELLADGQKQASVVSRPQLTFSANADNLLGLKDFKPFWVDFKIGNYISVQYKDDTYVKLRMTGYKFNPRIPTSNSLEITFSNYTRSKVEVTDLENLLGLSQGGGSSSGGSSSGGGGNYGDGEDVDIKLSNTMLSKLLNSELFGTRVKNVILDTLDVNQITAKTATFTGLANGTTKIDGGCITTGSIKSNNYSATSGSILNLNDGSFSFAGGALKWDGNKLTVGGYATTDQIPSDNYITTISKNTITSEYIKGLNLEVGNQIKMGANATISWGNVTGTDGIATTDQIPSDDYITTLITETSIRSSQITGDIFTTNANKTNKTTMTDGGLYLYRVNENTLRMVPMDWGNGVKGSSILCANGGKFLSIGTSNNGVGDGYIIINNGLNPDKHTEGVIFDHKDVRFINNVYIEGNTTIDSSATIKGSITINSSATIKGSVTFDDRLYFNNGKIIVAGTIDDQLGVFGADLYIDKSINMWGTLNLYKDSWGASPSIRSQHGFDLVCEEGATGFYALISSYIYNGTVQSVTNPPWVDIGFPEYYFNAQGSPTNARVCGATRLAGYVVNLKAHTGGVISTNSAITTPSDEHLKILYDLDDRYEKFFMNLKPMLYQYKHSGHRKHVGYGARQVEQALIDAGLTTEEFAGIVIQKNTVVPKDTFGSEKDLFFEDLYSLRYEEFGSLYAYMLQKAIKKINKLEQEILELKGV